MSFMRGRKGRSLNVCTGRQCRRGTGFLRVGTALSPSGEVGSASPAGRYSCTRRGFLHRHGESQHHELCSRADFPLNQAGCPVSSELQQAGTIGSYLSPVRRTGHSGSHPTQAALPFGDRCSLLRQTGTATRWPRPRPPTTSRQSSPNEQTSSTSFGISKTRLVTRSHGYPKRGKQVERSPLAPDRVSDRIAS
jgi:hypothetical protein